MPSVGDTAPDFELKNHDGTPVALREYRGQRLVLYFYPAAATSGCTVEAHSFRDAWDRFEDRGIAVVGVSIDPVDAIAEFRADENLPFTLLSDADGSVAKAYDVYDSGVHEGEHYEIAERTTFIIDADGRIAAVYEDVSPADHAEELLADMPPD